MVSGNFLSHHDFIILIMIFVCLQNRTALRERSLKWPSAQRRSPSIMTTWLSSTAASAPRLLKETLDAITEKVDDVEYLAIVLRKLHEVGGWGCFLKKPFWKWAKHQMLYEGIICFDIKFYESSHKLTSNLVQSHIRLTRINIEPIDFKPHLKSLVLDLSPNCTHLEISVS